MIYGRRIKLDREESIVYGTRQALLPLAHELMKLGLPTGIRQVELNTWSLEVPVAELMALEKVHVRQFYRKEA